MRCPRCSLAELNETTHTCALCGYTHTAASPAPSTALVAPTELDARRELARDFRIERLLDPACQPISYLARDGKGHALTVKVAPLTQLGLPADRVLAALESATRLDHPHIIPVHDAGTTEHFLWYATPHVEGRTLSSSLGTVAPIELPVCLRMLEQIASALEYAHRRGVTHGALRPECILVDANEWVLVGDFGTAGLLGPPESDGRAALEREAADQRALARMVRLCLTGTPEGNGSATPRNGHRALPLHVSQALRRAMSVQPAERFASTLDFVAALGGTGGAGGGAGGGEGRDIGDIADIADTEEQPARPLPDAAPTWFSAKPRKGRAGPIVIADSDDDPAASHWRKRVAAAAGVFLTLGAGATWLGLWSAPPASPAPAAPTAVLRTIPRSVPSRPQVDVTTPASLPPATVPAPDPPSPVTPARVYAPVPATPAARSSPPPRAPNRAPAPNWTRAPAPAPVDSRAEPALLSVNAIPWGSVFVDGRPIGNTPQIDIALPPGAHRLRVERDGFRPYERTIEAASGQHLRITDIALVQR
jgi:serine/threonine protein kinase